MSSDKLCLEAGVCLCTCTCVTNICCCCTCTCTVHMSSCGIAQLFPVRLNGCFLIQKKNSFQFTSTVGYPSLYSAVEMSSLQVTCLGDLAIPCRGHLWCLYSKPFVLEAIGCEKSMGYEASCERSVPPAL